MIQCGTAVVWHNEGQFKCLEDPKLAHSYLQRSYYNHSQETRIGMLPLAVVKICSQLQNNSCGSRLLKGCDAVICISVIISCIKLCLLLILYHIVELENQHF
jgi:hypothetical protein